MQAIEAHLFQHGFAYRIGGDEYLILLPNADTDEAAQRLAGLQRKLAAVEYPEAVENKPTISVGVIEVDPHCSLTNLQIRQEANEAKNRAKSGGKNRVSARESPNFRTVAVDGAVVPRRK